MKTLGIIPARYASSRFPGKPLAKIAGKTMLQRVYEQASKAQLLDSVVVATDDERIFNHVAGFKGNVMMTKEEHPSGTDRCAEAAAVIGNFDVIINIQGDEPLIDPAQIDLVVKPFYENAAVSITTLVKIIANKEELFSPNVVKVIFNQANQALYFSRSVIPHVQALPQEQWFGQHDFYKHIGLYGYRQAVLSEITQLAQSKLEKAESLEQLRWLEQGYPIFINLTDKESISVDTPEDLLKIEKLLKQGSRL